MALWIFILMEESVEVTEVVLCPYHQGKWVQRSFHLAFATSSRYYIETVYLQMHQHTHCKNIRSFVIKEIK
jgi:hypothetical protein